MTFNATSSVTESLIANSYSNITEISLFVNTSSNSSDAPFEQSKVSDHYVRDVFLLILYTITAIIAFIGNYFVCRIIFSRNSKLRDSTNILVANLSLSDLIGAVTIPAQWLFCSYYVLENWGFEFACAVNKSIQVLSFYMSSLVMMLIAIERYLSVAYPARPPFNSKLWVSVTWLLTTLFVVSSIGSAKIFEYFTPERVISCRIVLNFTKPFNSESLRTQRVYGIWLGQYVVPLLVTIILYALIVRIVWKQRKFNASLNSNVEERNKKQRKLVIMLVLVVVVFLLCWLPLHTLNFKDYVIKKLEKSSKNKKGKCNNSTLYFSLYWLGISSCCYNPFIYWWMNADFRQAFKKLMPRVFLDLLQKERTKSVVTDQIATEMSDIKLTNTSETSSSYIR